MKKYAVVVQCKRDKKVSLAVFIAENSEDALRFVTIAMKTELRFYQLQRYRG